MDTIQQTSTMGASSTPSKRPYKSIGFTSTANDSEEVERTSFLDPPQTSAEGRTRRVINAV